MAALLMHFKDKICCVFHIYSNVTNGISSLMHAFQKSESDVCSHPLLNILQSILLQCYLVHAYMCNKLITLDIFSHCPHMNEVLHLWCCVSGKYYKPRKSEEELPEGASDPLSKQDI